MINKNILIGLLAAWLWGSLWWQCNKIMTCEVKEVDQTAIIADSLEQLRLMDSIAATNMVKDSVAIDSSAAPANSASEVSDEDLAKNQKFETLFKPMNLYYKTSDANFIKTLDNEKFIAEALAYLKADPNAKLTITGHTDSDGDAVANLKLSKSRANEVKAKFVGLGFNEKQLKTEAKGETAPISGNSTTNGKKANRRVEIVVNQ